MKTRWLFLLTFGAGALAGADPTVTLVPAPRPHLTEELRKRVEDRAPPLPAPAIPVAPVAVPAAKNTVVMAPVQVNAAPILPDLRRGDSLPYIEPFTFRTGGIISRDVGKHITTETKAQWDGNKGWNLLGISF
jgi:hypothetical protein